MKKAYFKYIVLFFGIIIFIDFVGGIILKKYFEKISFGTYGIVNNSLKSNAEILILGSSRAMHHYNTEIISDNLNLSCYNAGLGGYGLFYNYAILNEKVKNKLPKIVILDLSPNVIIDNKSYTKLNTLLPYYKNYSSFKEIILLDSKFSKLELISNLYVYNSVLYDFSRDIFDKNINDKNGYVPLEARMNEKDYRPIYLEKEYFDPNKIIYIKKIINLCKIENIKLISVISPTYDKYDVNNTIINEIRDIFNSENIEFYDYSDFSKLYKRPEFFKDQLHMNNMGSDIFSKDFSKKIKK